jgi:hypothetical protein
MESVSRGAGAGSFGGAGVEATPAVTAEDDHFFLFVWRIVM